MIFWLKLKKASKMDDISKTVGGFRAAIQDLLVPELKAIQTELKHHSEEFAKIDKRFEALDKRFEAVDKRFEEVDKRLEAIIQSLHHLEMTQGEILAKLDVKEEVSQYTSKTNALEKRMDDLWALLKNSRLFSST
jgi:chromosome segregation ATPase